MRNPVDGLGSGAGIVTNIGESRTFWFGEVVGECEGVIVSVSWVDLARG